MSGLVKEVVEQATPASVENGVKIKEQRQFFFLFFFEEEGIYVLCERRENKEKIEFGLRWRQKGSR